MNLTLVMDINNQSYNIQLEQMCFLVLQSKIREKFDLKQNQYELYYKDIDGENTLLESQEDFDYMIGSNSSNVIFVKLQSELKKGIGSKNDEIV